MISWAAVAFNFCWILGLALLLAQFSYRRWLRAESDLASLPTTRGDFAVGLLGYLLIAVGLIGISRSWLERLTWLVLMGGLIALHFWTRSSADPRDRSTHSHGN